MRIPLTLAIILIIAVGAYFVLKSRRAAGLPAMPGNVGPGTKVSPPLTREIIAATTDDDDLRDLVCDEAFRLLGDFKNEDAVMRRMPEGLRAYYAMFIMDGEINNGGFEQYYVNTDGSWEREALRCYEMIGAKQHVEVVRKAIAIADSDLPGDERDRAKGNEEAFASVYKDSELSKLNDAYYDVDEKDPWTPRLAAYVRAHPEQFVTK